MCGGRTCQIHAANLERTAHYEFWQQLQTRLTTQQCLLLALHHAASRPSSGGTEALTQKQLEIEKNPKTKQLQWPIVICKLKRSKG